MNQAQQQTYYRQYIRWHRAEERIAVRLVLVRFGLLQQQLETALYRTSPIALMGILDMIITEAAHMSMYQTLYVATGTRAADREYTRLMPPVKAPMVVLETKDRDHPHLRPQQQDPKPAGLERIGHLAMTWRSRLVNLVTSAETINRIKDVAFKTLDLVKVALAKAIVDKLEPKDVAARIREVVVDKDRALLIARTETTRAANAGHELGALSTEMKLQKSWIALRDGRTRPDHLVMNDRPPIPADALFEVGGRKMKYPGDPAGGAKQTVGCRCVCRYDPAPTLFDN